ncbi:endo-alpha-N-acetylgalactosaminidase family protein [Acaricomes phytoseiuli]|uniref:endo-alpha-N-acetylgalactosaminidase family protein n=1 Tax=Acaricomes phytoseiuli TaxID=291968 RepID=UPI002222596E|nr:endo-alpha-N-acetylgalactosaminidase family protein [Acaricomes phytoseiuli]MCW1250071.1 endo-alpha-N-acetylgalactosaminidase family protein [Acaricomes phytoseiuli]
MPRKRSSPSGLNAWRRQGPQLLGAGMAAALLSTFMVSGTAMAAPTQTPPIQTAQQKLPDGVTAEQISSAELRVDVARDFPQVLRYTDTANGKSLSGSQAVKNSLTINGTDQTVTVTSSKTAANTVEYTLTPKDLPGVTLKAKLTVSGRTVDFAVTDIADTAQTRVNTLQIKEQDLVSVSSAEPGATVASSLLSVDRAVSGDTITTITAQTPADASPKNSYLSLVSTSDLAAALETNSLYDSKSPDARGEKSRFWRQAVKQQDGTMRMGVSSGAWLYRAQGSEQTEELPWAKVAITGDANADKTVNWQDAAIAYRSIAPVITGAADVKNRVITHIPFNFASQATNPFLRTLDNVKRISAATDGLGQMALLKGYTSEGHDSANSDFGGNYNTRAGGLEDMNSLLAAGKSFGATFGVHINATEAYPEANSFNEQFVDKNAKGWNWLDQSYYINQTWDITSGSLENRIKQLRAEADPNLTMTYVDVYYTPGWASYRTQKALQDSGLSVTSEWSDSLARNTTWSHWSADENYGPKTNKGVNSQILRFIDNANRDVWNPDPLLGNARIVEFEGWTGQNDYNAFSKNIWSNNLPTKFLQQQTIMRWADNQIDFTGGVSAKGASNDNRVVTLGGKTVIRGGSYLLPWSTLTPSFGPQADAPEQGEGPQKLYHYNPAGGSSTWDLTGDFARAKSLNVYKLTDNGRQSAGVVPVVNGKATVVAEPGQPYVLIADPATTTVPAQMKYGEATPLQDPGFNAGNLSAWNPTGGAQIERMNKGQLVARLGQGSSQISQKLQPLSAGTYSVSAWVEIQPEQKRPTTLSVNTGKGAPISTTVDMSGARNFVDADEKRDTYFQRLRVLVDVAEGQSPMVTFSAAPGTATVKADDFRVVRTERVPGPGIVSEDFENTDQGWGPFIKGDGGGVNDPKTHIAKRNEPYTQAGWNGKTTSDILSGQYSLQSHGENQGLVYRTSDYTVPLKPGRQYRVSFDYQSSQAGQYSWVTGYDAGNSSTETESRAIPVATKTTRWEQTLTGSSCGSSWFGLRKIANGSGEFTIDNVRVEDLGPAQNAAACATLTMSGESNIGPGASTTVVTELRSAERAAVTNARVSLQLPSGWSAKAQNSAQASRLNPGQQLRTTWTVTAPADARGNFPVTAIGEYNTTVIPRESRQLSSEMTLTTLTAPPTKDTYASDHAWIGTPENGWGPVEKDQANGQKGTGDGPPLRLGGIQYAKGLGAHAPSKITYYLGSQCSTLTSVIGIDDSQGSRGQAVFSVVGDGKELYTSPVMRGGGAPEKISVPLKGVEFVELKVSTTQAGNGNAWANWADAMFRCSP